MGFIVVVEIRTVRMIADDKCKEPATLISNSKISDCCIRQITWSAIMEGWFFNGPQSRKMYGLMMSRSNRVQEKRESEAGLEVLPKKDRLFLNGA